MKQYAPTTFRPGDTQTVAVADSSTVDAYVAFDAEPTASSSSLIIPAFTVEYFRVDPSSKVAFLRVGSTTGTARITEVSQ